MSPNPEQPELDDAPTIASLIALIGEEKFIRLSHQLGGKCIYIPHKPGPATPLAACIGLDAAEKIGQIYGGMMFYAPVSAGRHAEIHRLSRGGMSNIAIAHELRTTRRTVQRVLNGEKDTAQMAFNFDESDLEGDLDDEIKKNQLGLL